MLSLIKLLKVSSMPLTMPNSMKAIATNYPILDLDSTGL